MEESWKNKTGWRKQSNRSSRRFTDYIILDFYCYTNPSIHPAKQPLYDGPSGSLPYCTDDSLIGADNVIDLQYIVIIILSIKFAHCKLDNN